MNFHKSKVYGIRVSNDEVSNCARILRCDATSFLFTYLGVTVGANMSLKQNWGAVMETVDKKLTSWGICR